MKELKVIGEREVLGKSFKIYESGEEFLILAKDVAEWIDYGFDSKGNRDTNGMLRTIDNDEKCKRTNPINNRVSWFLVEDGVYEVLLQSRKPIAKAFKKEVKRVLKELRINGYYIATEKDNNWLGIREENKNNRLSFTDEIQEFVYYATSQGSKKPEMYYIHFTKLVNEKLGIPKGTNREDLNQKTLMEITALERVIAMKLPKLVHKDMPYKEVYKEIKKLIQII